MLKFLTYYFLLVLLWLLFFHSVQGPHLRKNKYYISSSKIHCEGKSIVKGNNLNSKTHLHLNKGDSGKYLCK